jgi:hypothetical protein
MPKASDKKDKKDLKDKKEILIIRPVAPSALPQPEGDRLGGKEHGAIARILGLEAKPIDSDVFSDRLCESIASAAHAVQSKVTSTLGKFSLEEIKISLAVTAEGHIGIASTGVEASIEVTLKQRSK